MQRYSCNVVEVSSCLKAKQIKLSSAQMKRKKRQNCKDITLGININATTNDFQYFFVCGYAFI